MCLVHYFLHWNLHKNGKNIFYVLINLLEVVRIILTASYMMLYNYIATYNLSNLSNGPFIARVELSNMAIFTKKVIKY